jgi:YVTN family beta-propeller protein
VLTRFANRDSRSARLPFPLIGFLILFGSVLSYHASGLGQVGNGKNSAKSLVPADPQGFTSVSIWPFAGPAYPVFDPANGYVYVPNSFLSSELNSNTAYEGENSISVINGSETVGSVYVNQTAQQSVYDPSNGYLYALSVGNPSEVYVISGRTIIANITLGGYEVSEAYDSANNYIYIATCASTTLCSVSVIQGTMEIATIPLGLKDVSGLVFNPSNGYVYATGGQIGYSNSGTVAVISGTYDIANVTEGSWGLLRPPTVYDPTNGYVYVYEGGSGPTVGLAVISGTSVIANISTSGYTIQDSNLVFDPSDGYVYAVSIYSCVTTGEACGAVTVISGTSVIANLNVGHGGGALTYNPSNQYVYFVGGGFVNSDTGDYFPGNLSVIANTHVLANVPLGYSGLYAVADPTNGDVYVTDGQHVSVIAGSSEAANFTLAGSSASCGISVEPCAILCDPLNGLIYIVNPQQNLISAIDGTHMLGPVANVQSPAAVLYDPSNGFVYAANSNPYSGAVYSSVSGLSGSKVIANIDVSGMPLYLLYDPANQYVYASSVDQNGNDKVSVISGTEVIANVTGTVGVDYLAFNPSNDYVYASNDNTGSVSVISGTRVIANVTTEGQPSEIIYDPANQDVYVANSQGNTVSIIQGTSVVANAIVGSTPSFLTFDPANNYVYVEVGGSYSRDNVSVINGLEDIANISVGVPPQFMVFNPSNQYIYVSVDSQDGNGHVSLISGTRIVANVTNGDYPTFLVYNPENGFVYVSNSNLTASLEGVDMISIVSGSTIVTDLFPNIPGAGPLSGAESLAYDSSNQDVYYAGIYGLTVIEPNSTSVTSSTTTTSVSTTGSSSTESYTSSTSVTTITTSVASSSSSSGGGIPEFPYQLGVATSFTILLAATYLLVRRRPSRNRMATTRR